MNLAGTAKLNLVLELGSPHPGTQGDEDGDWSGWKVGRQPTSCRIIGTKNPASSTNQRQALASHRVASGPVAAGPTWRTGGHMWKAQTRSPSS